MKCKFAELCTTVKSFHSRTCFSFPWIRERPLSFPGFLGTQEWRMSDWRKKKNISVGPTMSRTSWTVDRRVLSHRQWSTGECFLFDRSGHAWTLYAADASDDWDVEFLAVSAVTPTALHVMHSFEVFMQTVNWWMLPRFSAHVAQFTFCRLPVLF